MNIRKPIIGLALPFSMMLVNACGGDGTAKGNDTAKNDSAKIQLPDAVKPVYHDVQANQLAAFYVLNNQMAKSPDHATLVRWLDPFLDSLSKNGYDPSQELFTNNGGGVMNSQFNPDADMLIMSFFDRLPDSSSVSFSVNDFPIKSNEIGVEKMNGKEMYMCWTILSEKTINYMRHPASDKEIDSILVKRKMKKEEWINNSCTVIRVAALASFGGVQQKNENYLLLSFGQ
ncbi:MAG TPA: hypothetical protein VL651_08950 [Bacteroidia bacterium]|jgi:hypothetical protein|nr:hypothetical protein [Bacteroidia bacterium]